MADQPKMAPVPTAPIDPAKASPVAAPATTPTDTPAETAPATKL